MRLEGKVAVIVGAGQSPGEGIGNGRATTLRFAQEGARILAVDRLNVGSFRAAPRSTAGVARGVLLPGGRGFHSKRRTRLAPRVPRKNPRCPVPG
jgi:NAD(P)-dependent dehydrogenase (short-subunit alcohol dehydrogenase family)